IDVAGVEGGQTVSRDQRVDRFTTRAAEHPALGGQRLAIAWIAAMTARRNGRVEKRFVEGDSGGSGRHRRAKSARSDLSKLRATRRFLQIARVRPANCSAARYSP